MKINDRELVTIYGGALNVTATMINYLSTLLKTVYSIGQGMGGAMRRIASKSVCSI